MKKVTIFLPLLLTLTMLQGCHGGNSSSTQSTVRLVNGTSNPLDMYWSGSGSASAVASAITYGNASPSATISAGISSIALASHLSSPSAGTNFSFGGGYSYTMLAYQTYPSGPSTPSLQVAQLIDDQTAPVSGDGLIGVADYSGAGSLDVYMVLSGTSPSFAWASGISGLTKYFPEPQGNYHIQITGAGAGYGNDVRLDIPSVSIGNQQILTLVLTPTIGGGLVDGLLVLQQGQVPLSGQTAVTAYKNYSARVRIAANYVATIGSITSAIATTAATSGSGVSLVSNLSLPTVSPYAVVPLISGASTTPLTITLNVSGGGPVTGYTGTVTPGQDMTLLAYGNASTVPQLLVDDNTLPTSGAKLRLVNGINNLTGSISLSYNGTQPIPPIVAASGTASTATNEQLFNGTPATLTVGFGGTNYSGPTYSVAPILSPQGVYSLFMLGNSSAVSGVLSTDHLYQEH